MASPDKTYSLPELAAQSGIPARTIRYYITQGLLPAPVHAGPSTRYEQGHADRLQLIRKLQRQHLPLSEIRARLEQLRDDEVAGILASAATRPSPTDSDSALDYIRAVLSPSAIAQSPRLSSPQVPAPAAVPSPAPKSGQGLRLPSLRLPAVAAPARSVRAAEVPALYADQSTPTPVQAPSRSQWDRIVLAPDIELHVRRPLSRFQNRAVDRLIGVARQLLEEDPS